MMNKIKEDLESLFDDALSDVEAFRKKTYDTTFHNLCEAHKDMLACLETYLADTSGEADRDQFILVIPDYAQRKLEQAPKKSRKNFPWILISQWLHM